MIPLFVVDDPYEMNTLLRALCAAKFYAHEDGPELAGSTILARLCDRAVDGFTAAQEAGLLQGNAEETRARWANQPPGPEIIASVRKHLKVASRKGVWSRWTTTERADYIRLVFRPCVAPEQLVQELATILQ